VTGFLFLAGTMIVYLLFATASTPNSKASKPIIQCFPGDLAPQFHLVPRLRMRGAILSLSPYVFMVWCLIKQDTRLHGSIKKQTKYDQRTHLKHGLYSRCWSNTNSNFELYILVD